MSASALPDISRPSRRLLAMEVRAVGEYLKFRLHERELRTLPRGDGHPVMVIPGFAGSDRSTQPLRRVLDRLGYATCGWGHGRNFGMKRHVRESLAQLMNALADEHVATISVIGWSLGGVYARELARRFPDRIRRVITLGSPINGRPDANNVDAVFRRINPGFRHDFEAFGRRRVPPPVPCTAIYTREDGIVAWRCAMEVPGDQTESIEVRGSHLGLGVNLEAIRIIADRLARQPRDSRTAK